ncbi:MAG TPA: hypothetical protein VKX96_06775, partial [Chloroflexota bacterium]|nr:hypothetical protein [Chloroflexota bacterium]
MKQFDRHQHGIAARLTCRWSRRSLLTALGTVILASGVIACQAEIAPAVPTAALARLTPLPSPGRVPPKAVSSPSAVSLATAVPTSVPPAMPDPLLSPVPSPSPTIPFDANPEHLQPNGPPHDPGPLTWAHPGSYWGDRFNKSEIVSFSSKQPLITTYYFYWHDLTDPTRQQRIKISWTESPPDPAHYSFLNVRTHLQQFSDMQAAGIDFVLPVYWGEPGHPGRNFNPTPGHFWSTEGIPPMIEAFDQLTAARKPFKMGMFYDTTILANADLTTENGKAYFYVNVRDFYSRIPPRHWAVIDDKPIVWLYDTQWVSKFDQATFDDLSERFAHDFAGLRPYVVREWQW